MKTIDDSLQSAGSMAHETIKLPQGLKYLQCSFSFQFRNNEIQKYTFTIFVLLLMLNYTARYLEIPKLLALGYIISPFAEACVCSWKLGTVLYNEAVVFKPS